MSLLPKISIVTPTLNQGKFIEQTIQSVLNQNYPNLEYIIIDGGSTDDTTEILKKYAGKISYWISEKDDGQTDAINKGFAKCTGEIFNWLNSDDYYEAGALHSVANAFSFNQEIKVICGREKSFYDNDHDNITINAGSIIESTTEQTIFTSVIDQPCTFFKRESISGFFPLHPSLKYVMDKELWIKFLAKYGLKNILKIDKTLTWFRLHQHSKSVAEGDKFEAEFSILKVALLKYLEAPSWLIKALEQKAPENATGFSFNNLHTDSINKNILLSLYVIEFATRQYVADNLEDAKRAMEFVKDNSGINNSNWQLYFKTAVLPAPLINILKKAKSLIS